MHSDFFAMERISMKLSALLLVAVTICFMNQPLHAEEQPQPLTAAEADAFLRQFFESNKNLTSFSATIIQVKSGGVFKRPDTKTGFIRALLPSRLFLDMSKDGLIILLDGTYAWLHDTDLNEVERYTIKKKDQAESESTSAEMGGLALLLGKGGDSLEAIHQQFEVHGQKTDSVTTLFLKPKTESPEQKISVMELHFPQNAHLPTYISTTGIKAKDSDRLPLCTAYTLSEVKTNLDGLPAYSPDDFLFSISKDLEVRDMTASGGQRVIPYAELQAEQNKGENATPPASVTAEK